MAAVNDFLVYPTIASTVATRLGSDEASKVTKWNEEWGPSRADVIHLSVELHRSKDILKTAFFAKIGRPMTGDTLWLPQGIITSLGDFAVNDASLHLQYPKHALWDSASLDQLESEAVLILGNDTSAHLDILRTLETAVNQCPNFRGWLLRDYADPPSFNLWRKLLVMASCRSFIILEDSVPSGHLAELGSLGQLPVPIAILRDQNFQSTWMTDPFIDVPQLRAMFRYDFAQDPASLWRAVAQACEWARSLRNIEANRLDDRYPWRKSDIEMWQEFGEDRRHRD